MNGKIMMAAVAACLPAAKTLQANRRNKLPGIGEAEKEAISVLEKAGRKPYTG